MGQLRPLFRLMDNPIPVLGLTPGLGGVDGAHGAWDREMVVAPWMGQGVTVPVMAMELTQVGGGTVGASPATHRRSKHLLHYNTICFQCK